MYNFLQPYKEKVIGILKGFDRLLFRGTLRQIACPAGLGWYLNQKADVLLKDFIGWAEQVSSRLEEAALAAKGFEGRQNQYLRSGSIPKDELAREIAGKEGITQGPICIFRTVETCSGFELKRDPVEKKIKLVSRIRKCLHIYHYQIHPHFGFMHTRLQTWLPCTMYVCINGREWLSRELDKKRLGYVRKRNCFVDLEDVSRTQEIMDRQLKESWPSLLDGLRRQVNPALPKYLPDLWYYWSTEQSEWATDIMFKSAAELSALYPMLLTHGINCLGSRDVLRFLGNKVPAQGGVNPNFKGQVTTSYKQRPEGMRIRHHVNKNSIKMYDKQGSILRVETTIHDAKDIKIYRRAEGQKKSVKPQWRSLRKGIADLHRRAEVSDAANERYLHSLPKVDPADKVGPLMEDISKPKFWKERRVRALNPFASDDCRLLELVAKGEFSLSGFQNRDIGKELFGHLAPSPQEAKRRTAAVTRKLRLLRAHGIIQKVQKSHRYKLSAKGRQIANVVLAARAASVSKLNSLAA